MLNASSSSVAFMIVVTDGNGGNPLAEADAARAEGTAVFAVGVGERKTESYKKGKGGVRQREKRGGSGASIPCT